MNVVCVECTAPGMGRLFLNGNEIEGVISVVPQFLDRNSVATVTLVLQLCEFKFTDEPTTTIGKL